MQISIENLSDLERKLNITIPADKVEDKVKSKLQEIATKAKLPGFRPGKIPFDIIKKNYGQSAYSEVIENLIHESYPEALQKEGLNPAGRPKIEIITSEPGENFVYNATFEIYPEVKLVGFEKVEVEKPAAKIEDQDLNSMLDKMRKGHVSWEEVTESERKSEKGDQLLIDFTIKPVGSDEEPKTEKNVKFALGDNSMWDDFEKPLYGVRAGDEKEYALEMPSTHMNKDLSGTKMDFKVKVHKVSYPVLPELNDEFAAKMNIKEGGVEQLKNEVRSHMERELDEVLQGLFKQAMMEKVLDSNAIEVPKVLVENELNRIAKNWQKRIESEPNMSAKKPEFPRDQFESQARRNVSLGLMLSAVVQEQKLTVSPQEVRKKIEDTASAYYSDKDEMLKKSLADQEYMREIESFLLEEKVVEYLSSKVKILEKIISYQEAMEKK